MKLPKGKSRHGKLVRWLKGGVPSCTQLYAVHGKEDERLQQKEVLQR